MLTAILAGLAASSHALNSQSPPIQREETPARLAVNPGFGPGLPHQWPQSALAETPPDLISCEIGKPDDARDTDLPREKTVIGTVIDESVDRTMDERDRACIRALLDHQDNGQPVVWKSAEAGSSFSLVPIRSFRSGGGLLCREFSAALLRGDVTVGAAHHVACRQLNGDWLVRK